jgi:hypothetical protein
MAKITEQLIANFYDRAIDVDFSRDINFKVVAIEPGAQYNLGTNFITNDELVYAKSAKVPGRNITNVNAQYMGLKFNIPGIVEYPESENYSLEFYCDKNSQLRNKFEQWSRLLFNDGNSTGVYSVPQRTSYIQLAQLDASLNIVQQYKLIGASVRSLGDMEYKMAEGDGSIMSFAVTFAYHFYELTDDESADTAKSYGGP